MSHFLTLVLIDRPLTRDEAEEAVSPLLAPYDENGEWFADDSRWDWWAVGGRWTGFLDGYDPRMDPENFEACSLCGGSGRRPDAAKFEAANPGWIEATGGCNKCKGEGRALAWSTDWRSHEGDVQPVAHLLAREVNPLAVVTPDGKWHERARMGWFGMTTKNESGEGDKPEALWAAAVRALLEQYPDAYAVAVDCHV